LGQRSISGISENIGPLNSSETNVSKANLALNPSQDKQAEQKKPESPNNSNSLFEKDFSYVFLEPFSSFEDILEALNEEASKFGYRFNKGPFDKGRGYYSAYCKHKPRFILKENKSTSLDDEENTGQVSLPKKNYCDSFYRFRQVGNEFTLVSINQTHNHEGKDFLDLTEAMKMDLRFIIKSKRFADIMEFLEAKYKTQELSYQKVYYQFRKIKPLFGLRDCPFYKLFEGRKFFCRIYTPRR